MDFQAIGLYYPSSQILNWIKKCYHKAQSRLRTRSVHVEVKYRMQLHSLNTRQIHVTALSACQSHNFENFNIKMMFRHSRYFVYRRYLVI